MGRTIILGVLLVAAAVTPAFGQSFVGDWTATAHAQGTEVSETLSVAKTANGYSVTAKPVAVAPGGAVAGPGAEVVLEGNNFSYKRSLDVGGGAMEITYKGVVSGDTFSGTAEVGGTGVPYTGVRDTGVRAPAGK